MRRYGFSIRGLLGFESMLKHRRERPRAISLLEPIGPAFIRNVQEAIRIGKAAKALVEAREQRRRDQHGEAENAAG